jgi:adenosine deaminase
MRDFETMPKVELHLHLEGAIPLDAMWALVEAKGDAAGVKSPQELQERYAFRDFPHFIETFAWKNRFLDSYESFTFIAEAVAGDLARQGIAYAEAFFSPSDFRHWDLEPAEIALAIRRGLDGVEGTTVALIADLVRDTGPKMAERTFERVLEAAADAGVIGITIGGSEAEFPPEQFAPVYARAREAGFRLTAHAGEAAGPESVWGAIRSLGVERIGHGIRSVEDDRLLGFLVESQIPLEVCPTSNLRTGVVSQWKNHPLARLLTAGAMVTLNTDDPAMFGCTLAGEYRDARHRLDLDDTVMRRLARNAVEASWASSELKDRLRESLDDWWKSPAGGDAIP